AGAAGRKAPYDGPRRAVVTRRRIAVVLGLLPVALAAAFVLRRGGDGPSAEVGAPAPGDGTGDPMSADARPAAVPLAATGHAPAAPSASGADGAAPPPATAELTVTVLDAAGAPIPGARVLWITEPPASGITDR